MEPAHKKIRITRAQNKLEIQQKLEFERLFDVCKQQRELILQHLSLAELLKLSEVSSQGYQLVANAVEDKADLVIDERADRIFRLSDVENTKRQYKSVKVRNLMFERTEVGRMIFNFSPWLVSVESNYDFRMEGVILPSMKTLIMTVNKKSKMFRDGLLSTATDLSKLHFSGITYQPGLILECLGSNPRLKELVFENGTPSIVFRFMEESPYMELTSLKCDNVDFLSVRENVNFFNFLKTQSYTLKELKMLRCEIETLSFVLKLLPNLVKLTFSPPYYEVDRTWSNFPVHMRLRELNLIMTSTKITKLLVSAAPRVNKLYVAEASQEIFFYIVEKLPFLREFHYAYFRDFSGTIGDIRSSHTRIANFHPQWNRELTFHQI